MSHAIDVKTIGTLLEYPRHFWDFSKRISKIDMTQQNREAILSISPGDWVKLTEGAMRSPKYSAIATKMWNTGAVVLNNNDQQTIENETKRLLNDNLAKAGLALSIVAVIAGILIAIIGLMGACLGLIAALPTGGASLAAAVVGIIVAAAALVLAAAGVAGIVVSIISLVASYMPDYLVRAVGTQIMGGNGGNPFHDDPAKMSNVRRIAVYFRPDNQLMAIQFFWDGKMKGDPLVAGAVHGNSRASGVVERIYDLKDGEFITMLTGRSGKYVDQITFHTNHRTFGPFGGNGGSEFTLEPEYGTKILGLKGQAGEWIDAIGGMSEVYGSDQKGGMGGVPFLDAVPAGGRVKRIAFSAGAYIDSIQLTHEVDGKDVVETRHGGSGGDRRELIISSDERITRVSGRCGVYVDSMRIDIKNVKTGESRAFTCGGTKGENTYEFNIPEGKQITGFWGRSGAFVDAIGVCIA